MPRNQYPGTCYRCKKHVAEKEGHFERHCGKWLLQHANCAIKFRGTNLGKENYLLRKINEAT